MSANFKFEDSIEYHQIRERRRQIIGLVSRVGNYFPGICNAITSIVKNLSSENIPNIDGSTRDIMSKRNELFGQVIRPDYVDTAIGEFNSTVTKNPPRACAVANYSFAEYIFWMECEGGELKKYRVGAGNEEPQMRLARTFRRRAEEFYHSNNIEEAIKSFKEADSKYPYDFTVHYQLGMLYFFEVPDYVQAIEFFNKASKHSANKSKHIFIHSMVFIGLILRMMARCTNNHDLLAESYQALVQAYNADPTYIFSIYALLQCNSQMTSRSGSAKETVSLMKELLKKERFLLIQLIYDRAFDDFLPEIAGLCSSLTNEAIEGASDLFRKIDEKLSELSQATKFMTMPSKMTSLKNEFEEIHTQFNSRTFFDVVIASERATKLLSGSQEFLQEVTKNRAYFEMRDVVEQTTLQYNEEYKETMRPFLKYEDNYNINKQLLEELNKNYPLAEPEKTVKKQKNSVNINAEDEYEYIPAKQGWHDGKTFLFVKIISGCSTAVFMLAVILVVFLVAYQELNWVPLGLGALNLLCAPMYGSVIAEIYYVITENRRKNLQNAVLRLEKGLQINKTKASEYDKILREKYSSIIANKIKVSAFTAGQMLDMGIEGNFDKLRALMP